MEGRPTEVLQTEAQLLGVLPMAVRRPEGRRTEVLQMEAQLLAVQLMVALLMAVQLEEARRLVLRPPLAVL